MAQTYNKKIKPGDDIEAMVEAYFDKCEASKVVRQLKSGDIKIRQEWPSAIGLANYLGISKSCLYSYADGKYSTDVSIAEYTQLVKDVLTRAMGRIEEITLTAASNGDIDAKAAQLRLGQMGYSTRAEVEARGGITVTWEGVSGADAAAWGK